MIALVRRLGAHSQALKERAEIELLKNKDHVIFAGSTSNTAGGLTDISFEKRIAKKRVSLYFSANPEGIEAYRNIAGLFSDTSSVDLKYSPHLGQSRITFDWDHFWKIVSEKKAELPEYRSHLSLEVKSIDVE